MRIGKNIRFYYCVRRAESDVHYQSFNEKKNVNKNTEKRLFERKKQINNSKTSQVITEDLRAEFNRFALFGMQLYSTCTHT